MSISDIKLDNDAVIVTGNVLKSQTADFELDNPERRADNAKTGGYRRALVHQKPDMLVINYDQDYKGGVVIRSVDVIEGNPNNSEHHNSIRIDSRVLNIKGTDIMLDSNDRTLDSNGNRKGGNMRRALVHDYNDVLKLNYGGDYTGGVAIEGKIEAKSGKFKLGDTDILSGGQKKLIVDGNFEARGELKSLDGKMKLGNVELESASSGKELNINAQVVVSKNTSITGDTISIKSPNNEKNTVIITGDDVILKFEKQTGYHEFTPQTLSFKQLQQEVNELKYRLAALEAKLNG